MPRLELSRSFLRLFAICILLFQWTSASALEKNRADIHLNSDLERINIVVGSSSPTAGCPAGQYWDIGQGRCTAEVLLRTVNVSESCSCSCPSGSAGSCTSSRDGSYGVYGWRLPTSGQERISYNGATNWGSCYATSNSCRVEQPTSPTAPTPGTSWQVTIYICDASSPSWNTGVANLSEAQKARFVNTYRDFNIGKRCPEAFGYTGWQATWNLWANQYAQDQSVPYEVALEATWLRLQRAMIQAALTNKENTVEFLNIMNANCTELARSSYGNNSLNAVYLIGSGNQCQII